MTATITLAGSEEKLRQVLTFWETLDVRKRAGLDLIAFAKDLTRDGRRCVRAICEASVQGERLYQDELFRSSQQPGEMELHGVMGGIGRHWSKASGGESNPFIRIWDGSRSLGYHEVEPKLAHEILDALRDSEN